MSKIGLIAKIPLQEGKRDEFVAAFQPMLDHVDTEEGTETYILHFDANDENVVWVYELYVDEAAMATHSGSDAMQALFGAIGGLVGGAPEMITVNPVAGKGL